MAYYGEMANTAGFTGYYHLSDNTDVSGYGHHLTISAGSSFVVGKFGTGGLRGVDATSGGYVMDNLDIDGGACTISVWIKPWELPAPTGDKRYIIIQQGSSVSDVYYDILYYYDSPGVYHLNYRRVRAGVLINEVNYTVTLSLTTWTHIAITNDGAKTYAYYNGNFINSVAGTGNGSGGTSLVDIGGLNAASNNFKGTLDEAFFKTTYTTATWFKKYYAMCMGRMAPRFGI